MDKLEILKNVIEKLILTKYPWIKSVELISKFNDPMFGEMVVVRYNVVDPETESDQKLDRLEKYQLVKKVEGETFSLLKMLSYYDELSIKNFEWHIVKH